MLKTILYIPIIILKILITPFCAWLGYKRDEGASMASCDNPFDWCGPYPYPGNPYARERQMRAMKEKREKERERQQQN